MVVVIKEHVLIGIMQQSLKCRYRLAFNAQQARRFLSVSVLTSRTAGYVTRMSGGVGGALSDGRPYPYIPIVQVGLLYIRNILLAKYIFSEHSVLLEIS